MIHRCQILKADLKHPTPLAVPIRREKPTQNYNAELRPLRRVAHTSRRVLVRCGIGLISTHIEGTNPRMNPGTRGIDSRRLTRKQISYDSSLFGARRDVDL